MNKSDYISIIKNFCVIEKPHTNLREKNEL